MRHILIVLSFMFIVVNKYWFNCVAATDLEKLTKIKSLLCAPNKTDTAIVDKVIECSNNQTTEENKYLTSVKNVCKTIHNLVIIQEIFYHHSSMFILYLQLETKLTDCVKKANVSAYTKVDQTVMERKQALIMYCDKNFFDCLVRTGSLHFIMFYTVRIILYIL